MPVRKDRAATDREVVEHALWEVDFAERHGFESVWVTEHHFSGYARALQRTLSDAPKWAWLPAPSLKSKFARHDA